MSMYLSSVGNSIVKCSVEKNIVVVSIFNITLNIILVQKIGVMGVLVSTICANIFISKIWQDYILFKNYFKKGFKEYEMDQVKNGVITIIIIVLMHLICGKFVEYNPMNFIIRAVICMIIPNTVYVIIYSRDQYFKENVRYVKKIITSLLSRNGEVI